MLSMTTLDTEEDRLTLPVQLVSVAALRTPSARISRIHNLLRDPEKRCLVRNERSELKECPTRVSCSLRAPNSYPVTDTLEVLKSNSSSGVFGLLHDLLADPMVFDATKPGLLARNFLESSFCTSCTTRLKSLTMTSITLTNSLNPVSRMELSVGVNSKIGDPQINPKPIENFGFFRVGHVNRHEQEELPLAEDEVSLTPLKVEELSLFFATHEGDSLAAFDHPNADRVSFPAQHPGVEGYRPKGLERPLRLPIQLVSVSHLGDAANNSLSTKLRESLSALVVEKLVKLILTEGFGFERFPREPVTGSIRRTKRARQKSFLFLRRQQLHLNNELHTLNVGRSGLMSSLEVRFPPQPRKRRTRFLPVLKDGVSARENR